MTRGGATFKRKPETAHLNSETKQASAYEGARVQARAPPAAAAA